MDPLTFAFSAASSLVFLFQSIKELLDGIRNYIIEPSFENKQELEVRLRQLQLVYERFVEVMNEVESDLLKGKLEKVKVDIETYDSKLDVAFNNVEKASNEVVTSFEPSNLGHLSSYADPLFETTKDIRKLWVEFKQAVRIPNRDQAQKILIHTCGRVAKHVETIKYLANVALEMPSKHSYN